MHDNDHSWKYQPETRTLSITLRRGSSMRRGY